ncbi:DUF4007 family protein [Agrobacterium tumefaciens]|uniref:DUF4007 family protein n=1 Tax=Agrobacterium tumefaciens TaxID=358 RepID=UPI000977F4B2|nr:hypothetical protein BV900_14890 [Agrobacterium tumefaciens]
MQHETPRADIPIRVSGHETFPLRLLWLKKAYDVVSDPEGVDRRVFHEQSAIARFGVGKNMAISMRHWALAAGIIADGAEKLSATTFGRQIFSDDGFDPYLENHATLWLVHAQLASTPEVATTFHYAFNLLNQMTFTRDDLVEAMAMVAKTRSARATNETLKRDVEVFVRSYAARSNDPGEDAAEPLLVELGLLRELKATGQFEFVRGPKNTLNDAVFALVLKRFWQRHHPRSPTLSVELAQYGPGSPGRVFKLDENSLALRLMRISDVLPEAMIWSDTAGLRQVALTRSLDEIDEDRLLRAAYKGRRSA